MKKRYTLGAVLGIGVLLGAITPAGATTLDFTGGSPDPVNGNILNGGIFATHPELQPGGSGYIDPFVRIDANGRYPSWEQGTNTLQDFEMDEKPGNPFTKVFQVTADNLFTFDGGTQEYLVFRLDINQTAKEPEIQLHEMILYADALNTKYPYPEHEVIDNKGVVSTVPENLDGTTRIWDMDVGPDGDSMVRLSYNYYGGGSGIWGDLSVAVPVLSSDVLNKYFYLYSAFNLNNDGYEEWAMASKTAPVPEPATMLLFGTGLLGVAGIARRKKN